MKNGAIIQTRMGSTRLPGKVMLDLCGKPVIAHVTERLSLSRYIDEIIIATTIAPQDDVIAEYAKREGIKCFRGSEEDVLSRYYYAARENSLDVVIRITSDCPLIDPFIIDRMLEKFKDKGYDLVTNVSQDISGRTFPRGLDAEIFSWHALEGAYYKAGEQYQREHVTPYIYENSTRIFYFKNEQNYAKYRWTLDTEDDLRLIKAIYDRLYKGRHDFFLKEIRDLMLQNPELEEINAHVEQKKTK